MTAFLANKYTVGAVVIPKNAALTGRPRKGKEVQMVKRKKSAGGTWSAKDLNLLTRLFAGTPTAQIAKKVGRKLDAVKKKASRLGLKKGIRYLKSIGRV